MRTSYKLATLTLGTAALLPVFGAGSAFAADGGVNANLRPVASTASTAAGWLLSR